MNDKLRVSKAAKTPSSKEPIKSSTSNMILSAQCSESHSRALSAVNRGSIQAREPRSHDQMSKEVEMLFKGYFLKLFSPLWLCVASQTYLKFVSFFTTLQAVFSCINIRKSSSYQNGIACGNNAQDCEGLICRVPLRRVRRQGKTWLCLNMLGYTFGVC